MLEELEKLMRSIDLPGYHRLSQETQRVHENLVYVRFEGEDGPQELWSISLEECGDELVFHGFGGRYDELLQFLAIYYDVHAKRGPLCCHSKDRSWTFKDRLISAISAYDSRSGMISIARLKLDCVPLQKTRRRRRPATTGLSNLRRS